MAETRMVESQYPAAAAAASAAAAAIAAANSAIAAAASAQEAADIAAGITPGEPSEGAGVWGQITGTLADQTDLIGALNAKETPAGAQAKVDILQSTAALDATNKANAAQAAAATDATTKANAAQAAAATDATTKANAAQAAAIADATQYATRTAAQISDAGATGRLVMQAATESAAKAAVGLALVDDIATADFPVSGPVQTELNKLAPLTTDFIDLAGSTTLTLNRAHRDTISTNKNYTLPADPAPVSGQWWRLNLEVTSPVTITIPESKRVGTADIVTELELGVASHEIWNDRVGNIWQVSDTSVVEASGNVVGPVSSNAGRISVFADASGELLAEGTVTIAELQTAITDGDAAVQADVDANTADIATLTSSKAPLVSPDFTGGTPLVPTASRGTSTTQAASTAFVTLAENSLQAVTESTTARTLALTDVGKVVVCTNAGATTVTFPQDSDVAIPVDSVGFIEQSNTGKVTCAAGTGATIIANGDLFATAGQTIMLMWRKSAANTFKIYGNRIA